MDFRKLFRKQEALLAIDIGSHSVKIIELEGSVEEPLLSRIAVGALGGDAVTNNLISKPDKIAEKIADLLEKGEFNSKRVATMVPASSVFIKKIKMQKVPYADFANMVQMEAGNFIPHSMDAVRVDYHILGEASPTEYNVLIAAVKNEIVDSYLDCLNAAGLEVALVDVEQFALQNMFSLSFPQEQKKTVALINIGARYSTLNVVKNGESLFSGDISQGGRHVTEAIMQELGVGFEDAERLKLTPSTEARQVVEQQAENIAGEINRQLSFFWNAAGAEEGIERICLVGGGAQLIGLTNEVHKKTGIETKLINPFSQIRGASEFETATKFGASFALTVGLGLRQPGDRVMP